MLPVGRCDSYHAARSGEDVFRGKDGKSVFKVYYVDIIGRSDPSRTVWAECGRTRESFLSGLAETEGVEGVGFVTAFPHITKAFRFGPERETILNVRAWTTADMSPIDLGRGEGYVEFACLAEALIAGEEYAFWAEADSVEAYLEKWSRFQDGPIARNDKLSAYWNDARPSQA